MLAQRKHPSLQRSLSVQRAPDNGKWGGRGGSKWAPLPWTYAELGQMKAADLAKAKTKAEKYQVEQKYYRGKQVIKWWNEIYGNWSISGHGGPWASWFQLEMKPFGRFEYNPGKLWERFLARRASQQGLMKTETAINPFGTKADVLRYEYYKAELEGRDPTSVEFNMDYHKYIDTRDPKALVDPPKASQRFLNENSLTKPLDNLGLKLQIDILRRKLKKQGRLP